jgi:phosphotriesterase-related protein
VAFLRTVKGDVPVESVGFMLPHEHLFVDLRDPLADDYGQADPIVVAQVIGPYLAAAEAAGVTAFVDCAPSGVGRNINVLQYLATITPIHIIAPTGVYKEGFIPPALQALSAEALAAIWVRELTEGIDGTNAKAGFIKVAMSDDGPKGLEVRNLQAAAFASQQTGAVVGSHTIGGTAAFREMDILEAAGLDLKRFIWIHAHTEADPVVHVAAAERGAYIEFDAIGADAWFPDQARLADFALNLVKAGYGEQILLSHDAGWYEPGQPGGLPKDGIRGYTALSEQFIPLLRTRGADDALIRLLTVTNPARAFAFADHRA